MFTLIQPFSLADVQFPDTWNATWLEFHRSNTFLVRILPIVTIIGSYILFNLPLGLLDVSGFTKRYKIQPTKYNTLEQTWRCIGLLTFNYVLMYLPFSLFCLPAFEQLGFDHGALHSPFTMAWQMLFFLFVEDTFHYWCHRLLHTPYLYKKIHSWHHEFSTPYGVAALYAHPVEVVGQALGTFVGPFLIRPHIITFLIWANLRQLTAIESHSGYDFPFSPHRWIPFFGGSMFHDFHHRTMNGNYSSNFTWWDTWFGTDRAFRYWIRKRDSKKLE